MLRYFSKYSRFISIISLSAYIVISTYSLFHIHNINFKTDQLLSVEKQANWGSAFHQNNFCQIFHFNKNLINENSVALIGIDTHEFITDFDFSSEPEKSKDYSSFTHRGPPSI